MTPVLGYKPAILPDGSPGTTVHYADGTSSLVDANHQPITAPPAPPVMSPTRQPVSLAPTGGAKGYDYPSPQPATRGGGGGGAFRPTLQGPSGWAGPRNVGVHGGASILGDRLQTARLPDPPRKFNASGHPFGGGGGTSPLYDTFRAKGDAMAAKVRGMGGGASASASASSSGWIPHKYDSGGAGAAAGGGFPPAEPYVDPLMYTLAKDNVGLDPRVTAAHVALIQKAMGQYGASRKQPAYKWVSKHTKY